MTKRRGRGEGSIYQRQDGRWCASVSLGIVNNKRQRQYVYGKTKQEVIEQLKTLGFTTPAAADAPDKVSDMLRMWMAGKELGPDTKKHYDWAIEIINDALGGVKLKALHAAQINLLYQKLRNEGVKRKPSMVHEVFRAALRWAKRAGYLTGDPLSGVEPPRRLKSKRTVWTEQQTRRFIEAIEKDSYEALYKMAACLGAREAEVFGVRWEDIDLERGVWKIQRQLVEVDSTLYFDHQPKTEASRRELALPEMVLSALRQHKLKQMVVEGQRKIRWERRQKTNPNTTVIPWEKFEGLVFRTERGRALRKSKFLKRFKDTAKALGLPKIRFHDLRHGIATLLLGKNVHPKKVQELLGHANVKITLDTYSHVNKDHMREVATITDDLLGGQMAVKDPESKGRA